MIEMLLKMETPEAKEKYKLRPVVESPYGTMKRHYKKSHWFAIIFSSCLLMTFLSIHLILFILILFIAPSTVR